MKILFSALTLLISLAMHSQVEIGFFAGPQLTDARYEIRNKRQESSTRMGINAGMQFKIPFETGLTFSPSIMYNYRGFKVKFSSPAFPPDSSAIDNTTSFHTIELAFLLQHDFGNDANHFFVRVGPSLDFALFGNEEFNTKTHGSVDRSMKFGFADYGHYLASAIVQFGYESVSGLFVYCHYNYGLTSMNNADRGGFIGNRAVGITIGKYLKKNRVVIDTKNKE